MNWIFDIKAVPSTFKSVSDIVIMFKNMQFFREKNIYGFKIFMDKILGCLPLGRGIRKNKNSPQWVGRLLEGLCFNIYPKLCMVEIFQN